MNLPPGCVPARRTLTSSVGGSAGRPGFYTRTVMGSPGARRLVRPLAAVLLCLLLTSAAVAAPAEPAATDPELQDPVVASVNAYRVQNGLRPLQVSAQLTTAARQHALSMGQVGYFSHSSANGSSVTRRITSFYRVRGSTSWAVGEVQAWRTNSLSAEQALAMWLASPGHKAQLLASRWREIGVGAAHVARAGGVFGGRDVTIVVVDFGVRR